MAKKTTKTAETKSPDKERKEKSSSNPLHLRWQNFRSLEDTGWLPIRPLTILIGPNGSGKTSIIAPLLILKQSLESGDPSQALKTRGPHFDAGCFDDLIHDRDVELDLKLALRFHSHKEDIPKDVMPPPHYPPGELEVTFDRGDGGRTARLKTFVVKDIYGREMLKRTRSSDGSFTLRSPIQPSNERLRSAILNMRPKGFLFAVEDFFRLLFDADKIEKKPEKTGKRDKNDESKTPVALEIGPKAEGYLQTLVFTSTAVQSLLEKISFVGPLRRQAERIYQISGEHPPSVGQSGECAPEILHRRRDPVVTTAVNQWLQEFGFGFTIHSNEVGPDAFSVVVRRPDGVEVNAADTGFGLSQVLPLIVQCCATSAQTLIAEQPEIHLNPKLQVRLADLFVEATKRGHTVIVETHSEHLLLRLRRLVAEKAIKASDVALLFAEQTDAASRVREIAVSENGSIGEWPKGFFEDALAESLALATAQAKV